MAVTENARHDTRPHQIAAIERMPVTRRPSVYGYYGEHASCRDIRPMREEKKDILSVAAWYDTALGGGLQCRSGLVYTRIYAARVYTGVSWHVMHIDDNMSVKFIVRQRGTYLLQSFHSVHHACTAVTDAQTTTPVHRAALNSTVRAT